MKIPEADKVNQQLKNTLISKNTTITKGQCVNYECQKGALDYGKKKNIVEWAVLDYLFRQYDNLPCPHLLWPINQNNGNKHSLAWS